jgi:hypothetical protein
VPPPIRRIIELMMLMKALAAFFILVYIHISYSQTPATCLEHLKQDGWPKDGILRVEILKPGDKIPIKEDATDMSDELTMPRSNHKEGLISIDPSTPLPHEEQQNEMRKSASIEFQATMIEGVNGSVMENFEHSSVNDTQEIEISISETMESSSKTEIVTEKSLNSDMSIEMTNADMNSKETYANETIAKLIEQQSEYEEILKTDVPEVEKLINAVLPDDQYIVECKLLDELIN